MSDWFDNISSDVITQNDQCVDAELQVEYEEKHYDFGLYLASPTTPDTKGEIPQKRGVFDIKNEFMNFYKKFHRLIPDSTFDDTMYATSHIYDSWNGIFRDNVQLDLLISRCPGTFDAGIHQRRSDSEVPVLPVHTDAKIRPVPDFLPSSDGIKAGKARDRTVNFCKNLYSIVTIRFLLQEPPFLLGSHGALIRVREQIVSLLVGQDEISKYTCPVFLLSISQCTFSAVFKSYAFEVFH